MCLVTTKSKWYWMHRLVVIAVVAAVTAATAIAHQKIRRNETKDFILLPQKVHI